MKVKTTKRIVKKILNRELQNDRSNIKLFDEELKSSLQEDIKTVCLFLRKRQLKNWININEEGICIYRKYKFINNVDAFKYMIIDYISKAVKYHYNGF